MIVDLFSLSSPNVNELYCFVQDKYTPTPGEPIVVIVKPGAGTTCDKQDRNNCPNKVSDDPDNDDDIEETIYFALLR